MSDTHKQHSHTPGSDAEVFQRLARISRVEYDRCRDAEAERLGLRVTILDDEVERYRPPGQDSSEGGSAVAFETVIPWPEPVDGAEVLNLIASRAGEYLVLPDWALDAIALWCAHTHVYDEFQMTPRLNYSSPEKRCGKTTARDFTGLFVPRPVLMENLTTAVLFRLVATHKCAILADEVDCWLRNNKELLGLLNSGHRKGGKTFRCQGDNHEVRVFNTFAPAVLSGIGELPGTLLDRSITLRLERAREDEQRRPFSLDNVAYERELCRKLVRWCADIKGRLNQKPALPAGAFNRVADNWRPLFSIAEAAGGDWPARAARAFEKLTSQDGVDQGKGVLLLQDIHGIFEKAAKGKLPSREICNELNQMEERPWPEWGKRGDGMTPVQLAMLLRSFKIQPRNIKLADGAVPKGYWLEDFQEAFQRYLPAASRYPATEATLQADTVVSEPLPAENGSASKIVSKVKIAGDGSAVAGESQDGKEAA
jgi:putative DNA primase/helicase